MGFNQAPQKKQMSQPYGKPQPRPQAPPNPYLRSNQQAPVDSGPGPSPDGPAQIQGMGTKGMGQAPPPSDPRAVQRSVSNATLQGGGGAPGGGALDAPQVGGYSGPASNPSAYQSHWAGNGAPPSFPQNPGGNDWNRLLTDDEYQGVVTNAQQQHDRMMAAGGRPEVGTIAEALASTATQRGNHSFPDPRGPQSGPDAQWNQDPLDYLKRSPGTNQGQFARLPGSMMKMFNSGTGKFDKG